jgi:heat shock protein beta
VQSRYDPDLLVLDVVILGYVDRNYEACRAGIMEDNNNRGRLAKLVRFYTSKSPEKLSSLDDYVSRMKPGQKHIFFICAGSMEEAQRSPFLEKLIEQDYEVILFTEPMDEYMMQVRPSSDRIVALIS